VNQVTPVSLRYPLSVFNKNSTLKATHTHTTGVVVGPFEEEEEGTGVTGDVVKVKGEDPATPGHNDPGT